MARNKGSVTLAQQVARYGAISNLARELGVSHVTVLRWINGSRVPETRHRIALQERFSIGLLDWDETLPGDAA